MSEATPQTLAARARGYLLVGAGCIGLGLVVAGTVSPTGGGVGVVAGWLVLVYGIHRFGRSGAA